MPKLRKTKALIAPIIQRQVELITHLQNAVVTVLDYTISSNNFTGIAGEFSAEIQEVRGDKCLYDLANICLNEHQ